MLACRLDAAAVAGSVVADGHGAAAEKDQSKTVVVAAAASQTQCWRPRHLRTHQCLAQQQLG